MPFDFNPIAQNSNLVDILDRLLAGSGSSVSAPAIPAQQMQSLPPTPAPTPPEVLPSKPSNPMDAFVPETTASDKYMSLLNDFPQRNKPSLIQNILGTLASLGAGAHPAGISGGQPVGFIGGSPQEIMQAGDLVRYRPFYQSLEDWQSKIKPYEAAAVNEKNLNNNLRMFLYNQGRLNNQAESNDIRREYNQGRVAIGWEKLSDDERRTKIQQQLADNKNIFPYVQPGGTVKLINKVDNTVEDTGLDSNKATDLQKIGAQNAGKVAVAEIQGRNQQRNIITKAESDPRLPMYTDETGTNFQVDPVTGVPYKIGQKPTTLPSSSTTGQVPTETPTTKPEVFQPQGKVTKAGAKDDITAQTKGTMEWAKMIYPKVDTVRQEAIALEKRKAFGPIMSRLGQLASKIGTTGSPEENAASLDKFVELVKTDPGLAASKSADFAIGQFLDDVAFLASGTGVVHTRGRTGVQIIQQMKNLLSPNATIDMFLGRLQSFDDTLKNYANGPGGVKPNQLSPEEKDMRSRIESALKKSKKVGGD